MSSNTWTPDALSSEAAASAGLCWRMVEAQNNVSTMKLTNTTNEQERLETLIEATKPRIPEECRHLNFLLFTPFRYGAPYPTGSRFRRAGMTLGVFYASEQPETAAIEVAFYRLLFFAESPETPWPRTVAHFTAFSVEFATGRGIDLRKPSFAAARDAWRHPINYGACQDLCENARKAKIDVIKYGSARDPEQRGNIAILTCRAFGGNEPLDYQTWRIHLGAGGARLLREHPRLTFDLDRAVFARDPRIASMKWER
jgi:hypothetical protein